MQYAVCHSQLVTPELSKPSRARKGRETRPFGASFLPGFDLAWSPAHAASCSEALNHSEFGSLGSAGAQHAGSMGRRNSSSKSTRRSLKTESLSRALI